MNRPDESAADAAVWELRIERCASGEMDRVEERDLLAACEIEPDGWRSLALACLEHRRLTAALRPWSQEAAQTVIPAPPTAARRAAWRERLVAGAVALAVAACAAAGGYRLGLDHGLPAVVAGAERRDAGVDPIVGDHLAALDEPLVPEAARAVLLDAGIVVEETPVIYVVEDDDGGTWAVPERHLLVRLATPSTTGPQPPGPIP
jgi:hypothetical protein